MSSGRATERTTLQVTRSPSLRWITERLFVGVGVRHPTQVVMRFFALQ